MGTNGNNKVMLDCPTCSQQFPVTMPTAGMLNDLRVSIAAAPHEKPIRCHCGQYFVFSMEDVRVLWGLRPITNEQADQLRDSQIILPQPDLRSLKLN